MKPIPLTKSPIEWFKEESKHDFAQGWQRSKQALEPYLVIIDHRTGGFSQPVLKKNEELLSSDERERLNHYRFVDDKRNYLERTALLRVLLGIAVDHEASNISFSRNRYGKPYINTKEIIEFNTSHSKGLTLIGIHPELSIGVDIEKINSNIKWQSIAERWFPGEITSELKSMAKDQQIEEFFSLWCKFEAVLKCQGTGLTNLQKSNTLLKGAETSACSIDTPKDFKAAIALGDKS